ncbi:coproporphyrinogen III oxidase [Klebsiella pneumoniae]|nr:coproporphyrinogen III oxidase [Klebsiella pneumoniae]MBD7081562.1 coproporphyrinogen III oxidase [Klebsiella pneumoniae]MCF0002684.1 coproporphyrinogen III oxidase [Klebsiella pneumoniae]MCF0031740.1 coproporphyrinogen III oxidase [Klebsiella pneumoniae]MEB2964083.1 coproporphyrinogen III oxidase [Klebsiella pneumoniae]UNS78859.1 coproporphyrinogen III oxidase [Klebsiella pneumoniae]
MAIFCGLSSDIAIEQNILNRYVDIIAKECDLAGHPRHLPERGLRASLTW